MSRASLKAAHVAAEKRLAAEEAGLERWVRRLLAAARQVERRRRTVGRRRKALDSAAQAVREQWRRPAPPEEVQHA